MFTHVVTIMSGVGKIRDVTYAGAMFKGRRIKYSQREMIGIGKWPFDFRPLIETKIVKQSCHVE